MNIGGLSSGLFVSGKLSYYKMTYRRSHERSNHIPVINRFSHQWLNQLKKNDADRYCDPYEHVPVSIAAKDEQKNKDRSKRAERISKRVRDVCIIVIVLVNVGSIIRTRHKFK